MRGDPPTKPPKLYYQVTAISIKLGCPSCFHRYHSHHRFCGHNFLLLSKANLANDLNSL